MTNKDISYWKIFKLYLPLSLVSFGGPQAHVAMLHNIFVEEEKWISDQQFTELFAISQALPGPASSQLAYAITLITGGATKALFSFIWWTLPGTIVMIGFAYGINTIGDDLPRWLLFVVNGLTSAAVGLVALAANKIGSKVLEDKFSVAVAALSVGLSINFKAYWLYPTLMIFGGVTSLIEKSIQNRFGGYKELANGDAQPALTIADTEDGLFEENNIEFTEENASSPLILMGFWLAILIISIICRSIGVTREVDVFATLYFVGSIIFGGGPVF
jgi:chromate transport protein ChrA